MIIEEQIAAMQAFADNKNIKSEPKELWINEIDCRNGELISLSYQTEKDAINRAGDGVTRKAILYREVIE